MGCVCVTRHQKSIGKEHKHDQAVVSLEDYKKKTVVLYLVTSMVLQEGEVVLTVVSLCLLVCVWLIIMIISIYYGQSKN